MALELALFDLDGTLLPIDSDHAFGDFLSGKGIVDGNAHKARNDAFYSDYLAGRLDIVAYSQFALAALVDMPAGQLVSLHAEYMERVILPAITPAARSLVTEHQQRGDLCAVVTATNSFVSAPIARAFGVETLIATIAELDGGRVTGRIRGLPAYREGKIDRVSLWLESMALTFSSFSRTTFYSDSHNDLPLLTAVSHPVATNPDATLRAAAAQRGWRILDLFPDA